ncbi:MAG: VCBS repeat-containing protein [Acidobacteria bacterium]|nr:VCBS repeat-containing protein [Acidobacteriota bacterium]
MSTLGRRRTILSAALLASALCSLAERAAAQVCPPTFRVASGVGPAGATVLGAWDFDRDGRPDLLLQTNGEIHLAHNSGGSFVFGTPLSAGSVAVGDFDGDGILDIVAIQTSGPASTVTFLTGDGLAGFRAVSPFHASSALSDPVAADFDGDGKLDLAASAGGSDVWLYRGDGRGGFAAPYVLRTTASAVSRLDALDVDADGRSELLVDGSGGFAYDVFSTYTLGPAGIFLETVGPDGGGNQCPFDLAIGDVDGDGHPDAITVNRYVGGCPDGIRTFLARTGGAVQLRQPATSLWSPVLADFDGDGHTDLAAIQGSLYGAPTGLVVQLGDGTGAFGPPAFFNVPGNVNRETAVLTAADLDGDGRPDLVLSGVPGLPPLFIHNLCGNPHEPASPAPAFPAQRRIRP